MGAEDEAYVVIRVLVPICGRLSNSTCPPPSQVLCPTLLVFARDEPAKPHFSASAPEVAIHAEFDRHTEKGPDDGPPANHHCCLQPLSNSWAPTRHAPNRVLSFSAQPSFSSSSSAIPSPGRAYHHARRGRTTGTLHLRCSSPHGPSDYTYLTAGTALTHLSQLVKMAPWAGCPVGWPWWLTPTRVPYTHVIFGDFGSACLELSGQGCSSFVHGSHLTASVTLV
jgi:hypothetical protein